MEDRVEKEMHKAVAELRLKSKEKKSEARLSLNPIVGGSPRIATGHVGVEGMQMFGRMDFMKASKQDAYKLDNHGMKIEMLQLSNFGSQYGSAKDPAGSKGASRLASNLGSQK